MICLPEQRHIRSKKNQSLYTSTALRPIAFSPCLVLCLDPPNPLVLVVDTRRACVRQKYQNRGAHGGRRRGQRYDERSVYRTISHVGPTASQQ